MKAKAMVVVSPGRMERQEFDLVPPQADQILIKLGMTSVCASDPKIFLGKTPFKGFPIIMGHELVGKVADIGSQAAARYHLKPGDRITVEPAIPCGQCQWCRTRHYYHKCRSARGIGGNLTADSPPYLLGGYSEYMYILAGSIVHKVADKVPDRAACLSSVFGNGVRWIKTLGQMTFGQSLAISGIGPQGLATLIAAKECGVGPIAVLGLTKDRARFELAREFGADVTVDIEKDDPLKTVPELLADKPDVVVETSGAPSAILTALELVKEPGRVVAIGLSGGLETPIKFDPLVNKSIAILTDYGQAGNVEDAMRIINSGKYATEKIVNVTYGLEELPRALEETSHPPEGFIKGGIDFA